MNEMSQPKKTAWVLKSPASFAMFHTIFAIKQNNAVILFPKIVLL